MSSTTPKSRLTDDAAVRPRLFPLAVLGAGLARVGMQIRGTAVVLRTEGEIDLSCATAWKTQLDKAIAITTPPGPLVLDLDLDFLSCGGVSTLRTAQRYCEQADVDLRAVTTKRAVTRALHVTGIDQKLAVYPSASAALSESSDQRGLPA